MAFAVNLPTPSTASTSARRQRGRMRRFSGAVASQAAGRLRETGFYGVAQFEYWLSGDGKAVFAAAGRTPFGCRVRSDRDVRPGNGPPTAPTFARTF